MLGVLLLFAHRCQFWLRLKPPFAKVASTYNFEGIMLHTFFLTSTSVATPPTIACTQNLLSPTPTKRCPIPQVHRTSKSLIASIGVDSEWTHAKAAAAATPATAYLNADLWHRCCLLPAEHEFLYRTPALCSNASYSQANVPVTIVLSSKVRKGFRFCDGLLESRGKSYLFGLGTLELLVE